MVYCIAVVSLEPENRFSPEGKTGGNMEAGSFSFGSNRLTIDYGPERADIETLSLRRGGGEQESDVKIRKQDCPIAAVDWLYADIWKGIAVYINIENDQPNLPDLDYEGRLGQGIEGTPLLYSHRQDLDGKHTMSTRITLLLTLREAVECSVLQIWTVSLKKPSRDRAPQGIPDAVNAALDRIGSYREILCRVLDPTHIGIQMWARGRVDYPHRFFQTIVKALTK